MAAGFGLLRLSPQAFWAMTPRELECALGIFGGGVEPMRRAELAELMRLFPDK